MLCFAGFTPVANVDQATGDRAGNVVRSLRYEPSFLKREKLGNLPCSMNFSASLGSRPSMPRKIIFRTCAPRRLCRRVTNRHAMRNGQIRNERNAAKKPKRMLRKEPQNKACTGPHISELGGMTVRVEERPDGDQQSDQAPRPVPRSAARGSEY